jgi:hypothetical protein
MKTILKTLRALPLAIFALALGFVSTPVLLHADEAATTVSDNQFVDGNWFTIAEAKGESYKEGSATNEALNAQLELYQNAVSEGDTEAAEKYAIRSWVKANYAMELGRRALGAGELVKAKEHLNRALKLAKAAQKKSAGRGEQTDRVCDETAPEWRGCSEVEGKRAETRINKMLAKVRAKSGEAE